jgi:hypothetical protein
MLRRRLEAEMKKAELEATAATKAELEATAATS